MKRRSLVSAVSAAAVCLFLFSTAAFAEEQYQTEISGLYSRVDSDQDARTILYGVQAQIFFAPVKTEEHPYAEAAFLERIGSVSVIGERADEKAGTLKGDGPVVGVDVNLAAPGFPIAVEAFYTRARLDFDAPISGTFKSDSTGIRAGNYFTNTLLAGLEYVYTSSNDAFTGFPSIGQREKEYALFAKYVYELGDFREISTEATLGRSTTSDDGDNLRNTNASIAVDYFFNKALSAGLGFENSSGTDESVEGKTYSANVRYFIIPQLSIQVLYDRFLNSHPGFENEKTVSAIVAGRF